RDDAAVAGVQRAQHDGVGRRLQRLAAELHARGDRARDRVADELLAGAGAADRRERVRVVAGADDRRVADAAEALAGEPARAGRGREPAVLVAHDAADRAVDGRGRGAWRRGGAAARAFAQHFLEHAPARFGVEPLVG